MELLVFNVSDALETMCTLQLFVSEISKLVPNVTNSSNILSVKSTVAHQKLLTKQ